MVAQNLLGDVETRDADTSLSSLAKVRPSNTEQQVPDQHTERYSNPNMPDSQTYDEDLSAVTAHKGKHRLLRRMAITAIPVGAFFIPPFILINLDPTPLVLMVTMFTITLFITSFKAAAKFFIFSITISFTYLIIYYGGYRSPTIAFIGITPLVSYFLLGATEGQKYGLASSCILILSMAVGGIDFSFTTQLQGQTYFGFLVCNILGFFVAVVLYSRYYTGLTNTMVERISSQNNQLEKKLKAEKLEHEYDKAGSAQKLQHSYNQLAKVFYPHQLDQIRSGVELERTMPVGESRAAVIAFDIAGSSSIRHENTKAFIERVMSRCALHMVEHYNPERLSSDAYRIKEMGDGFLCSVGYPFSTPHQKGRSQHAYELCLKFTSIFASEVAEFGYHKPIHCGIGVAIGPIESYFPNSGTKQYDLHGKGIILATRYESFRKELFALIQERGNVIIIQEEVFGSLTPESRSNFTEVDLESSQLRVRDDAQATRLYYQLL